MSSVQCNGELLRAPEHGRINCPELATWIASAGERCRLECDSGYTPSIERITCFDYGWSIPARRGLKASQKVSCVSGGATTMLIIGLLVGGLILICLIAFAYAKFSDQRQKANSEIESDVAKKGSSTARRAAMEETVDSKGKRRNGKKTEPHPDGPIIGVNMVDPNINRYSPDSYASGFPLMMSSGGMGAPIYEQRIMSPASFNPYESFVLPHQQMGARGMGLTRHMSLSPGLMSQMPYQHMGPTGLGPPSLKMSQSFGAYDHVTLQSRQFNQGSQQPVAPQPSQQGGSILGGIKSKSLSPDTYPVSI